MEHVAVHAGAGHGPVIGLYLLADGLAAAEAVAGAVCRRALLHCPEFAGWGLLSVQAPLFAPVVDEYLALSGRGEREVDGRGRGPFGPAETSSGGFP